MHRCLFILFLLLPLSVWSAENSEDIDKILGEAVAAEDDTSGDKDKKKDSVEKDDEVEEDKGEPIPELKELSGLGGLAPFNDIAVIQKRFLPKTSRFEFFPGLGMVMNDVFFFSGHLGLRLGYYFSESYGLEITSQLVGTTEREVIKDLRNKQVTTKSLLFPQYYVGVDFKWVPVYGKVGLFNESIVPFELYFSAGGGATKTNEATSPPTLHLGVGEIFSIKKWMAFRWDLSWFWYSSSTTATSEPVTSSFMNMYVTVGMSFFFPEAKYR